MRNRLHYPNDDKSPLIDLLSCIVCNQIMKIEKSSPDADGISFNISADGATELSVCDYSAEPEMRWAEGEGEVISSSSNMMPHRAPRWCRIPIHRVHRIQKDENYCAVFALRVFRGRGRTNLGVPVDTEGSGAARLLR
jgi:hypothetical protein